MKEDSFIYHIVKSEVGKLNVIYKTYSTKFYQKALPFSSDFLVITALLSYNMHYASATLQMKCARGIIPV